ncbi:MAG: response regulator [Opitutaceae bacterium]|nr:response regulator [Opitutaceae bacterium]
MLVFTASLAVVGGLALAGWIFHFESLVQPWSELSPIRLNGALTLLVLSLALTGCMLGWSRALWLAVLPLVTTGLALVHGQTGQLFSLDNLLDATFLPGAPTQVEPASLVVNGCLLLASLVILLPAPGLRLPLALRTCSFVQAVAASLISAAGVTAVIGYLAALRPVFTLGGTTPVSPVMAVGLFLLGGAILLLAWTRIARVEKLTPAWAPLPIVIGCVTLTVVLWIGLRDREEAYLGVRTQTSLETLAIQVNAEFDRQSAAFERRARTWGDNLPTRPVWEADVHTQWLESSALGAKSFAWVRPDGRNRWVYPLQGNEDAIAFDHAADPVRAATLEAARKEQKPIISGTVGIGGLGPGFVIFTPIIHKGELTGYAAAEFLYDRFFATLTTARLKLVDDYHLSVVIGGETVHSTFPPGVEPQAGPVVEKTYTIQDRRMRISLVPTPLALARDRRFLPEFALAAGIGIAFLLGLSVHLARRARADQRTAEDSNARLHAENEERRRVETRLKIADERLNLALDSTQIGIFEYQPASRHVHYSPGLWMMLGYDPVKMPSTPEAWRTLVHPEDLPLYQARTEAQFTGQAAFIDAEYRVRHQAGDWRWIAMRSKTVASDAAGRPARIIGTMQDITARRESEQALRTSQAETRKLSLVAAKTDNPVVIGSPDGRVEWVNESFTRVMGYALEEAVGRHLLELITVPETDPAITGPIQAALGEGHPLSTDFPSQAKSGRKYHLHLEIQPVLNDSGGLAHYIVIATDITARVETEQQLRRAKSEADSASRSKSDFLASMSHEIRTPMNGVIGMTSLLIETPLTPEQREYVNTIRTSGEALLTIINDILDFSKIESGKMEIEHMPFELSLCLEEAFDLFALQASSRKLELTYHIHPDVPTWILSDVTRLRQIIVNLVNNAVKFTPAGSVSVEVVRRPAPAGAPAGSFHLAFTVRDTGVGIPADRLDRLFKAFSQVDSSTTRKYGGTGLGLAICQRLATLMGGDIAVTSTMGEGSAFTFTILTESAALDQESVPPTMPLALRASPILVVEDHPITQARLRTQFGAWGLRCEVAPTVAEALEIAARLPQPPSLLLIDGDETEGHSPLEQLMTIRAPRLLMLPFGQSPAEAPDDGLPFGTIYKPIKTPALLHALSHIPDPARLPVKPDITPPRRPLAEEIPLSVLLAEDNAVNQKVALRFLERLGYQADAVGNGLEAVTAVESRRYDLVLMDLQMPEMDGFEACQQIRRRLPPEQQPVIIALTANAMQGDRERCLDAGMDDYISKPVKMHEIVEAIHRQFIVADPGSVEPPPMREPESGA